MKLANTATISFAALWRNKVRSMLTALCVIIGVASVIAMIALSTGARSAIDTQIQSAGTNVVYISSGSFGRAGGARGGTGTVQSLTLEDANAIRGVNSGCRRKDGHKRKQHAQRDVAVMGRAVESASLFLKRAG